jgi:hypothetical protein
MADTSKSIVVTAAQLVDGPAIVTAVSAVTAIELTDNGVVVWNQAANTTTGGLSLAVSELTASSGTGSVHVITAI